MQTRLRRNLLAAAGVGVLVLAGVPPAYAAHWEPGFYGPHGVWHPGHWVGPGPRGRPPEPIEAPRGYLEGRVWLPGHYNGPAWIPGHWAER